MCRGPGVYGWPEKPLCPGCTEEVARRKQAKAERLDPDVELLVNQAELDARHQLEEARRAALTPEEREAEQTAMWARMKRGE